MKQIVFFFVTFLRQKQCNNRLLSLYNIIHRPCLNVVFNLDVIEYSATLAFRPLNVYFCKMLFVCLHQWKPCISFFHVSSNIQSIEEVSGAVSYLSVLDNVLQYGRSSIMTGFPGQLIVICFACAWLTEDDRSFSRRDSHLRAVEGQHRTGGHWWLQRRLLTQHLIRTQRTNHGQLSRGHWKHTQHSRRSEKTLKLLIC